MSKAEVIIEPGKQDIVVKRTFDATPDVVFKAITDPQLIPNWWGPRYLTTTVERMDVEHGGRWRYLQRDPQGHEFGFHGIYHDVVPGKRIVQTFEFEGAPGHVSLETLTLDEVNGKTQYTTVAVFQSVADRDAAVQSGMESGMQETYERLDEVLAGLLTRK